MPESNPTPRDLHCTECKRVLVPAAQMLPLAQFQKDLAVADQVYVAKVNGLPLLNADFICPDCGKVTYFRMNEQKLNLLLDRVLEK